MAKMIAESLRDMCIRIILIVAQQTSFDLRNVLSYPITKYLSSSAHCDGMHTKGDKSTLLRKLKLFQVEVITENDLPVNYVHVYDGGLVFHSVLSQTNTGASRASIDCNILSIVCSGKQKEVHLYFDKYVKNSIKESEKKLRGAIDSPYAIAGSEQIIHQIRSKLLTNRIFKNELTKFLLDEWKKDHYYSLHNGKILLASYGGKCYQYFTVEEQHVFFLELSCLQGDHEEADTLIAFHIANFTENVVVRSLDTDVLVILLGQLRSETHSTHKLIMDCGIGNTRRYIDITSIASHLNDKKPKLSAAMPGYHAFTGSDCTCVSTLHFYCSLFKNFLCCFFTFLRKGKVKPFEIIVQNDSNRFVNFFIGLGERQNNEGLEIASEFVCRIGCLLLFRYMYCMDNICQMLHPHSTYA